MTGVQRTLVVAASYRHAEMWWLQEGRTGRVPFISDVNQLRGYGEDTEVVVLDGAGQHPHFWRIVEELRMSRCQIRRP